MNIRAALTARRLVTGVLVGASGAVLTLTGILQTSNTDPTESSDYPTPAERLLRRHDCWTGEAPRDMRGKLPGHAVIQWGSQGAVHTGDPAEVGAAIDHVFSGRHPGLTVYGFCR